MAEFADEQDRERFAVGKLVFFWSASLARQIGSAIAAAHPVVDEAKDDQKQVFTNEIMR